MLSAGRHLASFRSRCSPSFVFALFFGGATLHATLPATRWWDLGHRIVARLADLRLTPHTRDAVREILDGQRMDDASVWADDIKNYRHDADPLHYVNIPLRTNIYVPSQHCPKGLCIIAAIEHDRRVLADPRARHDDKAEALRFLIHFMGDLHQPLHDADNADRGGNQRLVNFLGHDTNLHKVWDGELIDSSGVNQESYFAYLAGSDGLTRCHVARARHRRGLGDGGSPNRGGGRLRPDTTATGTSEGDIWRPTAR